MRPIKPNTRRRSMLRSMLLALLAIVLGGAGTVAALAGFKVIDLAKLWSKEGHPPGWIPIPLSGRVIPAYTEVTGIDLRNAKTGAWVEVWEAPDKVPKGVLTDASKIFGRVTAREKAALRFFTESDFLPKGTPAGIAGGTPPGKRAITLDATRLKGCVFELKAGDHLDLLASVPVDMPGTGHSGTSGTSVLATPSALLLPKRSFVNTIVNDAVVVSPVTARLVPITNSSLMNGTTTRNMRVQEIVIAVAPKEVAVLDEAMDLKYQLTCVARSGRRDAAPLAEVRPSDGMASASGTHLVPASLDVSSGKNNAALPDKAGAPAGKANTASPTKSESTPKTAAVADVTPGLDPMADIRFMEVMIGPKRQFMLFAGPGNSPVVLPQDDGSAKSAAGPAPAGGPAGPAEESQE